MIYLLVFEGELSEGSMPEDQALRSLSHRLSEAFPFPIQDSWAGALWEFGVERELIGNLITDGDTPAGFWIYLAETIWSDLVSKLLKEEKIGVSITK